MTSRHNEAVLARREKLRAQQKAELEAARQRHSQQATALAAVDRELTLLEEARTRARKAVVAAAELFGSEQDLADLVPLPLKEIRAMIREDAELQRRSERQAPARLENEEKKEEDGEATAVAIVPEQHVVMPEQYVPEA
ncbi:hypothetical protein ACFV0O_41405 [Kitasatospora sp. NPDC059577]|uniref:hypothetical protein n=1 Tax=unclassified Kitasatospora TaxID=2633591 RepID=UPI00369C3E35